MSAIKLVRESLDKTYHWHRTSSNIKAKAVLLHFRGVFLRYVRKHIFDEGDRTNIETMGW